MANKPNKQFKIGNPLIRPPERASGCIPCPTCGQPANIAHFSQTSGGYRVDGFCFKGCGPFQTVQETMPEDAGRDYGPMMLEQGA